MIITSSPNYLIIHTLPLLTHNEWFIHVRCDSYNTVFSSNSTAVIYLLHPNKYSFMLKHACTLTVYKHSYCSSHWLLLSAVFWHEVKVSGYRALRQISQTSHCTCLLDPHLLACESCRRRNRHTGIREVMLEISAVGSMDLNLESLTLSYIFACWDYQPAYPDEEVAECVVCVCVVTPRL